MTNEICGRLRRAKGKLSEEKVREWEEKKIKEGCDREIMKIVSEEFGKI